MLTKTSNAMEDIELNIQNDEVPIIDDHIIFYKSKSIL